MNNSNIPVVFLKKKSVAYTWCKLFLLCWQVLLVFSFVYMYWRLHSAELVLNFFLILILIETVDCYGYAGILCQSHRHLDGGVSSVCVCCTTGVCSRQLCFTPAQGVLQNEKETQRAAAAAENCKCSPPTRALRQLSPAIPCAQLCTSCYSPACYTPVRKSTQHWPVINSSHHLILLLAECSQHHGYHEKGKNKEDKLG